MAGKKTGKADRDAVKRAEADRERAEKKRRKAARGKQG